MSFYDIKTIFFDLDDTLCAYWDAAKWGLRQTFSEVEIEGIKPIQMMKAWATEFQLFCPHLTSQGWKEQYLVKGESTRTELMRRTLRHLGIVDENLAVSLSEIYFKNRSTALRLFPDARAILDSLKGQIPLGVMTNGPADIQRHELQHLEIEEYFDFVLIEGELGFGKPEERVFAKAEDLSGTSGSQILMVGNSFAHDIVPAMSHQWTTAWIRRPSDVPPSAKEGVGPEPIPTSGPLPNLIVKSLDQVYQALMSPSGK